MNAAGLAKIKSSGACGDSAANARSVAYAIHAMIGAGSRATQRHGDGRATSVTICAMAYAVVGQPQ